MAVAAASMNAGAAEPVPGYPSRPVRLIVAMPPGGGLDITARLIARELSEKLRQPFVVENRPGANSFIAARAVAGAPPDGYTLWLSSNSPMVTNAAVFRSLPYDPVNDFTPVARLVRLPLVIAVPAGSPYKTLDSLMAAGRAAPGKLNYASGSATYQVVLELIHERNHVKANAVPYKGTAPAMTDLAAGNVDYSVGEINAVMPLLRAGKVRMLAVTGAQRLKELPDVPTVAESGAQGFAVDGWIALYGPARMPPKLVAVLHEAVDGILRNPATVKSIEALSGVVYPAGPDQLKAFQASELERARQIVKTANIPQE
ncbi:ABC transporter substrate-binding protein [Cupriavidus sp. UYMSc13B]|nr:ABC transporter substrate-binding protein [Cupriavidus sp. UYMSc13B]